MASRESLRRRSSTKKSQTPTPAATGAATTANTKLIEAEKSETGGVCKFASTDF